MNGIDYLYLDEKFDELSRNQKKNYTVVMASPKPPKQPDVEKVLISWNAAARPFKRRSREFYVTLISVVGLVGAILFLVEGVMPVVLLATLVFLFYVLSTVAPDNVDYQITTFGVRFAGQLTPWEKLGRFWFVHRLGSDLLVLEVYAIPGRLELVAPKPEHARIEETLKKYLVQEEAPPGFFDKAAQWASKKLPQN